MVRASTLTYSNNLEAKRWWAPISRNPAKILVVTIGAHVVRASQYTFSYHMEANPEASLWI